jgi:hypothetical protein
LDKAIKSKTLTIARRHLLLLAVDVDVDTAASERITQTDAKLADRNALRLIGCEVDLPRCLENRVQIAVGVLELLRQFIVGCVFVADCRLEVYYLFLVLGLIGLQISD